jgi:hypothetical protein
LDPDITPEMHTLMEAGLLPLIYFEWAPELDSAFGIEGDGSVFRDYADLKAQFTFYRGEAELPPGSLEEYMGYSDGKVVPWIPAYVEPDPYEAVALPDTKVDPGFAYVGAVAGTIAPLVLFWDNYPQAYDRNPDTASSGMSLLMVGGMVVGGLGGFLMDAIFQAPGHAISQAKYDAKIAEIDANLPEPRTSFPENYENLELMIARIKEYNSNVLTYPNYSLLGLTSGSTMSEVVSEYGEPQEMNASENIITAVYHLAENDQAILEYSLGGSLLDVNLNIRHSAEEKVK